MESAVDEAFKHAVASGPERLLAGVALAAAGPAAEDSKPRHEDFLAAYGTLQLDPASGPMSTDAVMWFASCTKLVTSIAALQCVDRGLFDLDAPADIDRLLPEWKSPQILIGFEDGKPVLRDATEKITLRKLLSHTSGLTYDFFPLLLKWRQSRGESVCAYRGPVEGCFTHPLVFEPGTGFYYGPGVDVAGLMVARANNCSLESYLRKNIFDVLDMADSSLRPSEHHNLAERLIPMVSRSTSEEPLVEGGGGNEQIRSRLVESKDDYGGGSLFSTAEDFLKLLKSVLRNDGRVLKSKTVDLMFSPCISVSSKAMLAMQLSESVWASPMIPGEPLVGTPGASEWSHGVAGLIGLTDKKGSLKAPWIQWGGAPNLKWWIDREGGTCGVFATQLGPPGEGKHQQLTLLFQKEMTRILGKLAV